MKKVISPIILIFILFFSSNLHGEHICFKMSLSLFSGGGINDSLSHPEYAPYIALGQQGKNHLAYGFSLDLFYQVNAHLSFSLGSGYQTGSLKGNKAEYSYPKNMGFSEFHLYPRVDSTVHSICFSALYSLPLKPSILMHIMGGIGYYLGSFEERTDWYIPSIKERTIVKSRSFKASGSTLGYQLGTGFDLETHENIFLSIDILYRIVNFKNLEIKDPTDMYPPQFYFSIYESRDLSDFSYRVKGIDMSGILIHVGCKCRF